MTQYKPNSFLDSRTRLARTTRSSSVPATEFSTCVSRRSITQPSPPKMESTMPRFFSTTIPTPTVRFFLPTPTRSSLARSPQQTAIFHRDSPKASPTMFRHSLRTSSLRVFSKLVLLSNARLPATPPSPSLIFMSTANISSARSTSTSRNRSPSLIPSSIPQARFFRTAITPSIPSPPGNTPSRRPAHFLRALILSDVPSPSSARSTNSKRRLQRLQRRNSLHQPPHVSRNLPSSFLHLRSRHRRRSGRSGRGEPATVQNSYQPNAERGPSVTDQRNRFVAAFSAEPRFFHSNT